MGVFTAATDLAPWCANDNETVAAFLLEVRGQAAALIGVGLSANPYRPGSFEADCWSAGWVAGERDMAECAPAIRRPRVRSRLVALQPSMG